MGESAVDNRNMRGGDNVHGGVDEVHLVIQAVVCDVV